MRRRASTAATPATGCARLPALLLMLCTAPPLMQADQSSAQPALQLVPEDALRTRLVKCATTKGPITIEVHPAWSPLGAKRFLELVEAATPELNQLWRQKGAIKDDPHVLKTVTARMKKGMVSFAGGGVDSRTTQLFVSLRDSNHLGKANWETPIGQIVEGTAAYEWHTGYGDSKKYGGNAPEQGELTRKGSAWAHENYPRLDFIVSCEVVGTQVETGAALDPALVVKNIGPHDGS